MMRKSMAVVFGALFLLTAPPAQAKKDGVPGDAGGGRAAQHMSDEGRMNANSPAMGQERGGMRADERKSEQGLLHGQGGEREKKAKPAAKGAKDKARGRDR